MGDFEELQQRRDSVGPRPNAKPVSKAPLPKNKPRPPNEYTLRVNVARAALINAQHWFDKGITSLEAKHPLEWRSIVAHAFPSLQEAQNVIAELDGAGTQVADRLDETRRAMDLYIERMTPRLASHEAATFLGVVDRLRASDSTLRLDHDLPRHPKHGTHKRASNQDDVYEGQALGATLDLIAYEARSTLDRVRESKDEKAYRPAVIGVSVSLQKDLAYAVSLFDAYDGKDKERVFTTKIQIASTPLAGLQRFIVNRENNKEMADQFAAVEAETNKLRAGVRLSSLATILVGTSNAQENSQNTERADVTHARSQLATALNSLQVGITTGAHHFYELAKLTDPPDDGSMWAELVQGLVISLLGNAVGPALGALASRLAASLTTKVIREAGKSYISGSATDTTQAWAGPIVQEVSSAISPSKDKRKQDKDALFFQNSLVLGAARTRAALEHDIDARMQNKDIAAGEIREMAAGIARDATDSLQRTFTSAARDFALMLAQRGLGTDAKPNAKADDKKLTRIGGDYLFGPPGFTDGKRVGTNGIARIEVSLDASAYSIGKFEIVGLNKELTKAVYDRAKGRVGSLGLPTEIELKSRWSRDPAMVVVDETGRVRFSTPWHMFARGPREIADPFSTPDKAWSTLAAATIPNTFGEDA